MVKHISYACKCRLNKSICESNQESYHDKYQRDCKNYRLCEKDYSWNPSALIYEKNKYLKSTVDHSVRDEILNATDNVSTNLANVISRNVMRTVAINFDAYVFYWWYY